MLFLIVLLLDLQDLFSALNTRIQTNSLTLFFKSQLHVDKFYLAVEIHQYGTTIPVILKQIFYSALNFHPAAPDKKPFWMIAQSRCIL